MSIRHTCGQLLQYFEEALFVAKLSKCDFQLSEFVFLGHVVSTVGIVVDPAKVEAVLRR